MTVEIMDHAADIVGRGWHQLGDVADRSVLPGGQHDDRPAQSHRVLLRGEIRDNSWPSLSTP